MKLEVFDVQGRRIRQVAQGMWSPGVHAIEWDGRDSDGRHVQPGIYIYRLEAGTFRGQRKLVIQP